MNLNIISALYYNPNKTSIIIKNNGVFTYNVPNNATRSSAGIYEIGSGDKLVRTLWGNRKETPDSVVTEQWDGLLDNFVPADLNTQYSVRILTNDVTYNILGGIGNKGVFTGNVWRGFAGPNSLAFVGNRGWWGEPFSEGGSSLHDFYLNDLSQCFSAYIGIQAHIGAICTDGTNVYVCAKDDYGVGRNGDAQQFVYGFKGSDYSPIQFSTGVSATTGQGQGVYNYYINLLRGNNNLDYTGIAVNNRFIYVSCSGSNSLYILDKNSGSVLNTISYTGVNTLCASSDDLFLWIYDGANVKKYALNNDGSLGSVSVAIPYSGNVCFNISPLTNELAVTDNITNQLKFYDTSNGNLNYTKGLLGGYNNSPEVTYEKFMFDKGAIAFQSDGSYWLVDSGNYRTLHFNSDHSYKEQFAFIPACRTISNDFNNPARVFADNLEYHRDYSKPLTNPTSWYLKYNWGRGFWNVVTMSNGHTYGLSGSQLYDLTSNGAVYKTNINYDFCNIETDGSLYVRINEANVAFHIVKKPLIGFDSNNVPLWGDDQQLAVAENIVNDILSPGYYIHNVRGAATNNKRQFFFLPIFDYDFGGPVLGHGFHLGSIRNGGNTWEWRASNSTYSEFEGDYPRNGQFDIGNTPLQHSENCLINIVGSDLIWHVNGEFWGAYNATGAKPGGEVNISNHYHESGLMIGNFGATSQEAIATGNNSKFAGNSFSTTLVKVNNKLYYNTCDENQHSAVSQWEIDNLDTIAITEIPISLTKPVVIPENPFDLLDRLPYRSQNFTGNSIWSIEKPNGLLLRTNTQHAGPEGTDLAISSNQDMIVKAKLPNTARLAAWTISGEMSYVNSEPTFGTTPTDGDIANYIEVLDQSGKIIIRFIGNEADTRNNYYPRIWFNNTLVAEGAATYLEYKTGGEFHDINFHYNNGNLTIKYSTLNSVTITTPYEYGADMTAPAYIRVNQHSNRNMSVTFAKLKFAKS